MNIQREILTDKDLTVKRMRELVEKYHKDLENIYMENGMIPLNELSLRKLFSFVRDIPFLRDSYPSEVIARPYIALQNRDKGLDCKKKAVILASWLRCNRIPYRFIGSSQRSDRKVHHIFPQGFISGKWKNIDATYPDNVLYGMDGNTTYSEILR